MAINEVSEAEYNQAIENIQSDHSLAAEEKVTMLNNIIKSQQFLIDSELKKLRNDVTKQGVILETKEERIKNGIYNVRIGDVQCEAYSQNGATYEVDDVVYVTIPEGDYKNQKFIMGLRAETNEEGIFSYSFPFDDFIQLKELINQGDNVYQYRANQKESELIKRTNEWPTINDTDWHIASYPGDEETPLIGTKLGVTVDIQSLLIDSRPVSGDYGLKIVVKGLLKNKSGEASTPYTRVFYFNTTQMYGNPYVYPSFTTQQAIFDLSDAFSIGSVDIYFWQDPESDASKFINEYNEEIPWKIESLGNRPCEYNLLFKKLAVYSGYAMSEMEGNKVYLYTFNDLKYGQEPDNVTDRTVFDNKTCMMAFVYQDKETGKYKLYDSDEELEGLKAKVYWYIKKKDWVADSTNPIYGIQEYVRVGNPTAENKTDYYIERDGVYIHVLESDTFSDSQTYYKLQTVSHLEPYDTYAGTTLWAPIQKANVPEAIETYDQERYSSRALSFTCSLDKDDYRIRVAVEIDGQHYLSDVIIFQNILSPEADAQSIALNNKVVLRVGMLMSLEDGTRQILYPDETLQHFMVYDENNRVLTTDDKKEIRYNYNGEELILHGYDNVKFSDIEYFVDIWIRDDKNVVLSGQHDWNAYVRLADWAEGEPKVEDNYDTTQYKYNPPFKVTWDLPPTNESMMEFYRIPQEYKNTSPYFAGRDSINVLWTGENAENILTKFDVDDLCTRAFKIKDMYNYMYANNTITAKIERAGQTFNVRREFHFGKAMMQGSCYTPMINIVLPTGNSYIVASKKVGNREIKQTFQLECRILDMWGRECYDDYTCRWSFISRSENMMFDGSFKNQELSDLLAPDGVTVCGHNAILTAEAPFSCDPIVVNVEVTLTNPLDLAEHDTNDMKAIGYSHENLKNEVLHARRGLRITDDEWFLTNHSITCPDRIQFCSDGQSPQYYSGNFICKYDAMVDDEENGIYYDDVSRFFYPTWHLDVEDQFLKNLVYLKVTSMYDRKKYPVFSSDEYDPKKNYMYLDYEKGDYQSYDPDDDDEAHRKWKSYVNESKMVYTQNEPYGTSHGLTSAVSVKSPPETNEYRMIYQPSGVGSLDTEATTQNSWVWKDAYATDPLYLISLRFKVDWQRKYAEYNETTGQTEIKSEDRTATFVQALAFDRSLYPSSLINMWNGKTLTLDYENGAVLATMMAAGTKNATTGAFTGVMMGNWASKGDETFDSENKRENASGIYGFLEGAGSFAFLDDGTGYIGPAGKGRIQFDGNNALISNSDKSCYLNLNPNTLAQSGEGYYNTDNKGISPYFLYCKIPVDAARCIAFDTERDLTWADEFMADSDNNYFVVDPAHGLLTSGGIVSKYGRIGNWYINSTGLYQKYIHEDQMKTWEAAVTALNVAKNFLKLDPPLSLKDHLTDEEKASVLANTNATTLDDVTIELIDTALENVQASIHAKLNDTEDPYDFTADRFMYLGMPGLDQTDLFTTFNDYQKLIDKAEEDRQIALGKEITLPEGSIANLVLNLYPYLDKSAFTMDVYHYFNTFIAVQANLDYIVSILKEQQILNDDGSLKVPLTMDALKSALRAMGGVFKTTGSGDEAVETFDSEQYESKWQQTRVRAESQYNQGEITWERYDEYMQQYNRAMALLSQYQNFESTLNSLAENVRNALYDKDNLAHRLFVYKLINEHYHNHYNAAGQSSPAQYGLFPNVENVLGVTLPSNARQTANFNIEEDGQYYSYSGIWQSAGEKYKTLNDIGATRASSYDPRPYDTDAIRGGITYKASNTTGSLNFWIVAASAGMPASSYEAPTVHPLDSSFTIYDNVWKNGRAVESSYTVIRAKLNSEYIDLLYLVNTLLPDLTVYCYYYDVYYNQALFYMLEQGLAKTEVNNIDDYTYAMTIINEAGGLENIKRTGLAASHTLSANFSLEGYDDSYKQRIKDEYYRNVNNYYDNKIADLKYERSLAMNKLYAEQDTERYAIYAAYHGPWSLTSPSDWSHADDPLFGVKWNGYLLARHGKIGYTSPWYIGDAGLTQQNNSGIIFLGDPEVTGRAYTKDQLLSFQTGNATKFLTENGEPIVTETDGTQVTFLLPNSAKLKLKTANGYTEWVEYTVIKRAITTTSSGGTVFESEEELHPTYVEDYDSSTGEITSRHGIAVYEPTGNTELGYTENTIRIMDSSGNIRVIHDPFSETPTGLEPNITSAELYQQISASKLGPETFNTYGEFAIYAGDKQGIHFGVRLDGTVYGNRAQFDGIRINNSVAVGTTVEHSNFLDITIQNTLFDSNGNPIVDDTGNPYHSYTLVNGQTTYLDQNGNTSTYYGGTTTYTDEQGNQQTISNTGQTFTDPAGHEYTLSGQGYSYVRPDGSYTYVDENGIHFHTGYEKVTPNADQNAEGQHQDPHALGWYERVQEGYYKKVCQYSTTTNKDTKIYTSTSAIAIVAEVPANTQVDVVRVVNNYAVVSCSLNNTTKLGYINSNDLNAGSGNDQPLVDDYENPKFKYSKTNDRNVVWAKVNAYPPLAYFTYSEDEPVQFQFATQNKFVQGDDAAIADTIIREKMMLMGGTISAWGTNNNGVMATYRYNNNSEVVESIALDPSLNQIRVGSGQIVLDGTTGVLFIGNKIATNGDTGSSIYTMGTIYLARVALVGLTTGATTYSTTLTESSVTSTLTTYTGIQYNQDARQDNEQDDTVSGTGTGSWADTDPGEYQEGGAYLVKINTDVSDDNRRINLVNQSLNQLVNNNRFDVGLFADETHPYIDETTGIPDFDSESHDGSRGYGFRVEFLTNLDNNPAELKPSYLKTLKYDKVAYTDDDLADIGFEDGICIIRPFKTNSILGTPARRWNIYANEVQIGNSYAATIAEVYENDARLMNNIIRVNEATAAAFRKAVQALNAAWSIIRRFKRYMNGELTEADANALGLRWENGHVVADKNTQYIADALSAALTDATMGLSLSTTIAGLLSNDSDQVLSKAIGNLLTTDSNGALSKAISGLITADADNALSGAIASALGANTDAMKSAISSAIESALGEGNITDSLKSQLSSVIDGMLGESGSLYATIVSIAQSVFDDLWEGVAVSVTGTQDGGTVTVTGGNSHSKDVSFSVTYTLDYDGGTLSGSPYIGTDGAAHCTHSVSTITPKITSMTISGSG